MISENGLENLVWFLGLVAVGDETKTGRVKVRCFGIHSPASETDKYDLPWATCIRQGSRFYDIPTVGELVFGFFLDGRDAQQPVVIGVLSSAKYSFPDISYIQVDNQPVINQTLTGPITYGGNIDAILATIRLHESSNNYLAQNGSATGAYQFIGSTWKSLTSKYGIGTEYPQAYLAPPSVQDSVAAKYVQEILSQNGNDVSKVPLVWYTGNPQGIISQSAIAVNNGLTPAAYQAQWLSAFFKITNTSNTAIAALQGQNPLLDVSQKSIDNFGHTALPPQLNGVNVESTPLLTQAVARKETTVGGFTISEPFKPFSGSSENGSVWETKHNGSYIELGTGDHESNEFISISHVSGSHIILDGQGNITIKSFGRLHTSVQDESEEVVEKNKLSVYKDGYKVTVSGGVCEIHSAGDMSISTGGDLSLTAAGKLKLNAGDSIDIAGSKIAATARVDSVDIISVNKMALQSVNGSINFTSTKDLSMLSNSNINLKSSGNIRADGSFIYLADPGNSPTSAEAAIGANLPNPPAREFALPNIQYDPKPPQITPDQTDDVTTTA